ncbi:TonB family protein [Methylomonas sp. AM2-LC]|uniref:energy transducer TonB n=1 Tax=Methylomonas sp. AM2-LC TaxID=3153301 RepID=UPI003263C44B
MENQAPKLKSFSLSSGDTLLLAVFLAALIHALILLGVGFNGVSLPEPNKVSKSVQVTLTQLPAKTPPKHAKSMAAENQQGGGDKNSTQEMIKESLPGSAADAEAIAEIAEQENKPEPQKTVQKKVLTRPESATKLSIPLPEDETAEAKEVAPKLSAADLQQQIAQLGERIRDSQQSSENSKIKFVSAISAHKYLASQYVKDWEDKVERTGNLNYPDFARNIGDSQTLTMDVGINPDGSIYSMRIVKSSGNPALDESAKRIVKMSAPFAALPADLLKEVNVLVITRVWKFSDETGMTTR